MESEDKFKRLYQTYAKAQKKYREKNKEYYREYHRKWQMENRARVSQYQKEWRQRKKPVDIQPDNAIVETKEEV